MLTGSNKLMAGTVGDADGSLVHVDLEVAQDLRATLLAGTYHFQQLRGHNLASVVREACAPHVHVMPPCCNL